MQSFQAGHAPDNRLRVVFDDRVLSFTLSADATYGEVARAFAELSKRPYGNAVSVDVTFAYH